MLKAESTHVGGCVLDGQGWPAEMVAVLRLPRLRSWLTVRLQTLDEYKALATSFSRSGGLACQTTKSEHERFQVFTLSSRTSELQLLLQL